MQVERKPGFHIASDAPSCHELFFETLLFGTSTKKDVCLFALTQLLYMENGNSRRSTHQVISSSSP